MKLLKLENGIKLAFNRVSSSHTVSFGVFFGVGSRYEDETSYGISHFIEHLAFKGTPTRTAFDIARQMELIGAKTNAFTSKDCTAYYVSALDDSVDKAVEILADIVINPLFPEEEIEKERGVVLEEIDMSEDTPDDLSHELMMSGFFKTDVLGKPILGDKEIIKKVSRSELLAYRDKFYVSNNMVISVTGNITEKSALELVSKYFIGKIPEREFPKYSPVKISNDGLTYVEKIKDIEQANVTIAFKGVSYNDEDKRIYTMMLSAIGDGMSSLLFQRLREQQGLCYSVYSYPVSYVDCGVTGIYVGTSREKLKKAFLSIKKIIDDIIENGISEEDFLCSKAQEKSGMVFAFEKVETQMRVIGKYCIITGKCFNRDKELKKIEQVTIEQVNEYIKKIFSFDKCVISYVGRKIDLDLAALLRGENG